MQAFAQLPFNSATADEIAVTAESAEQQPYCEGRDGHGQPAGGPARNRYEKGGDDRQHAGRQHRCHLQRKQGLAPGVAPTQFRDIAQHDDRQPCDQGDRRHRYQGAKRG